MADPGAVPLGGSLVLPPVAAKEEKGNDGVTQRNPSSVARNETGEVHCPPPILGGGSNATTKIRPLNTNLEKEEAADAEEEQTTQALTLLSIQGSSRTCNNEDDEDARSAGSLHDKPGSDGSYCSSHKGKAAVVTETSPLTLLSGGVVAAGDTITSRIEKATAATESPLPSPSGNSNSQHHQQQQPLPQQEHKGKARYGLSTPDLALDLDPSPSSLYPNTRTTEEEHSPIVSQLPLPLPPLPHTPVTVPFQPLQVGEPGWEKSADRPPKKLPIRFKDAVGRNYVFPWERAKSWDGMKGLIDSCFAHVEVIGPHVLAGHYDLITTNTFSTGLEALPQAVGTPASTSASPAAVDPSAVSSTSALGSTSTTLPLSPAVPPAVPSPPAASAPDAEPSSQVVILPEVWEDMVEPGMSISQHMWPVAPFQAPTQQQPQQPPPPLQNPHLIAHAPGRGRGRGRGIVAGRGFARGQPPGHLHGAPVPLPMPPPPPHFMPYHIIDVPRRRIKSRKRPERP